MLTLEEIKYHPSTSQKSILNGINLSAQYGNPLLIAGESGSGKTTLIEIISGLTKPKAGEIKWSGKKLKERQRRWLCGVVFQFPERHFLGLTVSQELKLGHRRLSTEKQLKVLHKVGLYSIDLLEKPERLSGGQQRRLAVAVQLLREPSILLLDEPTAGLDWSVREEILNLLIELSKEKILIVATHEPELFKEWKLSAYYLNKGKITSMNEFHQKGKSNG